MSKHSSGMDRRTFVGLTSAAAVAAAGGWSSAAEGALQGPGPARLEEIKSENPHGGQLVAHALKREGISRLFTLCGGHILPILDGCLDEDIKVIDGRHEEAVAHMAEAWSRITGEVGIISVTAGPGVTNAVTGVANAYENGVPMLVLGGRSSVEDNEIGSLQDIDQMELYETITKWSRVCYENERIPEYVALAFRHALSGRPAPVYLELPMDVLMGRVDKARARFPENYRALDRPRGSRECIAEAAKILSEAKRPLIMVGAGCRWSDAQGALRDFAEHTQIPVVTHSSGRGAFPDSHPLSLFPAFTATMGADAVILLGVRVDFMLSYGKMFPQPMKVIQVDIEPSNLGFNRGPECAVAGDIAHVLEDLKDAMPKTASRPWAGEAKKKVEMGVKLAMSQVDFDAVPIHPARVAKELREFVERPGDISPALERAVASGKPACVNVTCQTVPIG